jgi:ribosomal protein S18 acetylase RimI-like enzyme
VVAIVAYADEHFDGVDALWSQAFPTYPPRNRAAVSIPKKLAEHPELFLIAVDEDFVVGSAMVGYDGHRGWLYSVAVLSSHRRRRLAKLGRVKINLQITGENFAVAEFYKSLGYAVEERISMGKVLE